MLICEPHRIFNNNVSNTIFFSKNVDFKLEMTYVLRKKTGDILFHILSFLISWRRYKNFANCEK